MTKMKLFPDLSSVSSSRLFHIRLSFSVSRSINSTLLMNLNTLGEIVSYRGPSAQHILGIQ